MEIMKPLLLLTFATAGFAQSIEGLGVSGGDGPRGGLGDGAHVVRHARAIITDALIPYVPNTTRTLAEGPAPVLSYHNLSQTDCKPRRQVIIDTSKNGAQQEMVGFGHAWTDSTVEVFNQLEPDLLNQVMEDLFSPTTGNNMGFMRHTIGSSDLSYHQYSYDDNGPSFNLGEPDPTLSHFSLGQDGTAMAKMIARMGNYKGDVFLFGSPWSYPGWMKNNALFIAPIINTEDGQFTLANNSFNPQYIPQAIDYLLKYIDAYLEYGVSINGITMENEPLNYQGGYPCMYLDAVDEANLLNQGLGEGLRERGAIAMLYDHNTDQPVYPYRALQGAPDYAKAVAWHCYQNPAPDYSVLSSISQAYPGTLQFMTECSSYRPGPGSIDFHVAQNFIKPVQYGASGASMWVMATNENYGPHSPFGGCDGCLGSIIVNSSTVYTKTHDYYMIGQFSRFVRRGGVNHRVLEGISGGLTDWGQQFWIMAVQNPDKSWAVIFMNYTPNDEDVVLSFTEGNDQLWEGTIPNGTVVTWLLPSQQILGQVNGTNAASIVPPYPMHNTTAPLPTGSGTYGATGTGRGTGGVTGGTTGGVSSCPASSSTSTTSSSSSNTVIPVPNTTHSLATAPPYR